MVTQGPFPLRLAIPEHPIWASEALSKLRACYTLNCTAPVGGGEGTSNWKRAAADNAVNVAVWARHPARPECINLTVLVLVLRRSLNARTSCT